MIKNEYTLKVDLKKKYSAVTPTFVQYDTAVLRFVITDDGKPLYFTGQTSIKTYHRRKDGVVVEGDARVETVKGQPHIVYEYKGNEMYQLGFVETSLVIYTNDKKVSIQPFNVKIVDNIYDDIATPSNPEHGALQYLIARVDDLVDKVETAVIEAQEAVQKANKAAENVQSTISEWKFADNHSMSINYKKNNVVTYNGSTFIAIKDHIGKYPIGNASDEYWRIMALRGQDGVVVLHKEEFTSTANQTEFTLPHEYDQHQGRVRVIVDGVEQFTPHNFVEVSSRKIKMNTALRKDADVKIIYFGNAPALKNDIQLQIDNINDLLEHFNLVEANDAIAHATTQGNYAKAQGDLISTSLSQVNEATTKANTAATSATNAASGANTAKDSANTATTRANTAAALAESATTGVTQAKNDAISAANDANIAKNNANTAAINANDAVANLVHKGEYSATENYLPRNVVSYQGSSYMNTVASRGVLPTDTARWKIVGVKGAKGDTGFGFTWRGSYNATTAYVRDDVVYSNGSSYIALKSVTGVTPTNDGVNWNIVTQRGLDGAGSVSSVNGQTGAVTGLETVTNSNTKLSNKVDKVAGKQLSTEDFTTANKSKLDGIETGAQVNDVTSVNGQVGDVAITPSSIDALSKFGGTISGDFTYDGSTEHVIAVSDTNGLKHGFFFNGTSLGLYDWTNAKNIMNYNAATKTMNLTPDILNLNGSSVETVTGSQSKVDTHANKKDNPHAVTASQVGAYTKAETDNKIGILSENVVSKTLINKASGVAGLDEYGMISSERISDTFTQQPLNQAIQDMSAHRSNSGIHVTSAEKTKIANASQAGHKHEVNDISGLQTALDEKAPLSHTESNINETETHGMRVNTDGKFEYFNGTDWVEVSGSGGEVWEQVSRINFMTDPTDMVNITDTPYKKLKFTLESCRMDSSSAVRLLVNFDGGNNYSGNRFSGTTNTSMTNGLVATPSLSSGVYFNGVLEVEYSRDSVSSTGWIAVGTATANERATAHFFRSVFKYWKSGSVQLTTGGISNKFISGFLTVEGVKL